VAQGLPPDRVVVYDVVPEKAMKLASDVSIQVVSSAQEVVERSDVTILAVKPHAITSVAQALSAHAGSCLWMSIAAGITTKQIERALGEGARVVRAMPNTPALVGMGATGVAPGSRATPQDVELAGTLLGAVGITETVDESMMDAVTALSGSGPAFVMMVIESMADGAVRAGLSRSTALELAAHTVRGAAALLIETQKHPGELKDMVTSPGGTTIAGIEALEAAGLRSAIIAGITAAAKRSKKLSQG
jgi:pyrroline-5-carboxylate reductase